MRKTAVIMLVCAGLLSVGVNVQANEKKFFAGVEGAFVLPLSNWSDTSGVGIGGLARAEYYFLKGMAATFRVGYIHHLSKEVCIGAACTDLNTTEVPFMIGYKYLTDFGLFAEVAPAFVLLSAEAGGPTGGTVSSSDFKFGFSAGTGYQYSGLGIGAYLFVPSVGDIGDLLGVMFTVGYSYGVF